MDKFLKDPNRDTVLFVNEIATNQIEWVIKGMQEVEERLGRKLQMLIISDKRDKKVPSYEGDFPFPFEHIYVDMDSIIKLEEVLLPYMDKVLTVVCRGERNIPYFQKLIPFMPFVRTPTTESLGWATNKIDMRRRLRAYDKSISPKYSVVNDSGHDAVINVAEKLKFPVMVKPASLAASVLVSAAYHEDELSKVLKNVFRKLKSVHKKKGYNKHPDVLVEEFMEGSMFSTDIYVNSRGTMTSTPLVMIQTGANAGYGDFFGYKRMLPTGLKKDTRVKAIEVAKKGVEALGLRSITAHVELMKTPQGFKIIEIGPRVGGFRDFMYEESFGINHAANDILTRLPLKPIVNRTRLAYSCVMQIFPKEQGTIESVIGIKKARAFESVKKVHARARKGDKALFASNGGGGIADIYLANEDKSKLLADIRRVEQTISVKIEPRKRRILEAIPKTLLDLPRDDILLNK